MFLNEEEKLKIRRTIKIFKELISGYVSENYSSHKEQVSKYSGGGRRNSHLYRTCRDEILKAEFGEGFDLIPDILKESVWLNDFCFAFLREIDITTKTDMDIVFVKELEKLFIPILSFLKTEKLTDEKVSLKSKKVFIVHGRDNELKQEVARFFENLKFEAIILQEQTNEGKTIIEKFEKFANEVVYAIILYTACDEGRIKGTEDTLLGRARQNVVFEHGYLMGCLGRGRVSALVKGEIETHNDISGMVYINYKNGEWKEEIKKELIKCSLLET